MLEATYILQEIIALTNLENVKKKLPFAAVGTDGISSLMFKTSGHFDSIDCTKKCKSVDLLSDVLVLPS